MARWQLTVARKLALLSATAVTAGIAVGLLGLSGQTRSTGYTPRAVPKILHR